jgi:heme/copper-type cytochrome/quinol oxidase subunit 3
VVGRAFLAAVLLFLATIVVVQVAGQPGYAGFTAITSGVATVSGGVTAAVAILRHQERGALVLIPLITGLLLVVFVIGEIVSPH